MSFAANTMPSSPVSFSDPVDRIQQSVRDLMAGPGFQGFLKSLAVKEDDLILLNNSFVYA